MKRRHYKLYRVKFLLNYISHPLMASNPYSQDVLIGVAGNVTLEESQLEYHFTNIITELLHSEPALEEYSDFTNLEVHNQGMVEAMPVGMGTEDDSKPLSFHSGLAITTDDYIVLM